MNTNYTAEHRAKLEAHLATHDLPAGLGNKKSACTLAAINLALSGELTDDIPDCMSKVLGHAAIKLQDAMPDKMRNSKRYKDLIPNMPGTGQEREAERLAVLMDWMWTVVLPQVQPVADKMGFGAEWRQMCDAKTTAAAYAAGSAAGYAACSAAHAACSAAHAACSAAAHAAAGSAAGYAACSAAHAACSAAAHAAARAAAYAAAAYVYADAEFWAKVDPIGVLERMTYLEEVKE